MSEGYRKTTGKLRVWPLAGLAVLSTVILVVGQGVLSPSGQFAADTAMNAARQGAAAATLADGRILITGGLDSNGNPLASAEFLGSGSTAGTMTTPRTGHIAVALQDGRVLVSGGRTSGGAVTNTAEVFDPAAGSWTTISAMLVARAGATATLLADGRVLVTGGDGSGSPLQTTEIFDPASGQFNNGAPLTTVRRNHAAALLADGRVVIAGGSNGSQALASMDIYDPASGQVAGFGSMTTPREGLSATTLLDGKVLLAGGGSASTEILDPATGAVAAGPAMSVARTGHLAQLLPNNNTVLVAGGTTASATAEIFVEWQNQFLPFGNLSSARIGVGGGASMQSATARIAGGADSSGTVSNAVDKVRFPMVMTDKADYSPGTTVNITGSGFQPGETVTLILTEFPNLDTHTISPVVADAVGNISSSEFAPDDHDVGIRFYLTATGASGLTAEATFTDARNWVLTFAGTGGGSVTITPSTGTVNAPVSCGGTGAGAASQTITSTCSPNITTTDNAATVTFSASAGAGSAFGGWSNAANVSSSTCSGTTNPCSAVFGSSGTLTVTFNVLTSTTTTVSAIPASSSAYGTSVQFMATVTPTSGTVSCGTVVFKDGANTISSPSGIAVSSGAASFSTSTLSAATHSISAVYTPAASGCNFTGSTSSASSYVVNKKALTVSGITVSDKVYDGSTTVTLNTGSATLVGIVAGDTVTLNATSYTANFNTKDVGTDKAVTVSGLALSGTSAANYTLTQPSGLTANISAKALTASGLTAANKTYGATTTATVNGTAALQTAEAPGTGTSSDGAPYTGDAVSITGTPAGTFASKEAANGITVNITGLSLTGAQGGNYTLTAPTTTANITAKTLTASGLTANNKIYDSTTSATLSGTAVLQVAEAPGAGTSSDAKPYTGDAVSVTGTPTGTFVSKNVATGITVNISGLSLTGAQAGDYTLTAPTSSANITALAITGSITASNKVYDGTATATILTRTLSGVLDLDVVTYTGGTATFADKNVGPGKTVTGTGLSLGGADAANYSVNSTATTSADITARPLTITATSNTKTYDGTTSAAAAPAVSGLQTGDTVTGLVETYDNKNAGSGKVLSVVTGYTVNDGNLGGNYAVTLATNSAGVISAKAASVTPAASGKTYGDIDPPLTGTLSGFLPADNVVAGYARAPGEAVATYLINAVLSPAGVLGNYNITYNTAAFVISPKLASVTPNAASKTFGDADPTFSGTLTGFLPADNVTATYSRTAGETVTGSPYTISATLSPTAVLGNYTITYNTANFTIQKYTIAGCPSAGCGVDSSNNPNPGAYVALSTNNIPFMGSITAQVTMRPYSVGGEPLLKQTIVNSLPVAPAFTVYLVPQDGGGNPVWAGAVLFGNGTAVQIASPSGAETTITAPLPGTVVPGKYYAVVYGAGAAALGTPGVLDDAGYTGTDTGTFIYPTLMSGTLTVVKADQTITFGALSGKNYGDPAFTVSATGGASGNAVTFSSTTAGTCSVSGSTVTIMHAGSCTIEAAQAGNSNYNDATPVDRSFTISPAPLTITAENKTKAYGAALPALTVHYSGLVNGDGPATFTTAPNVAPTVTTTATASSHVVGSPYSITASGAVDSDYTISYVAGTLTVTPVPLQITANNQTKVYGAALPALTVSYSGLVSGDNPATFSTSPNTAPTVTTTATAASHVAGSPYTITASGAVDSDYSPITYTPGTLTVTPAALTITADNKAKAYGAALPALTASYAGFVNSDTYASLTTQPSLSTTATAASHVAGNPYPITANGAVDTDYNISYTAGTLTITAVPLTITADNQTKAYGAALPTLTVSYAGLVNSDTPATFAAAPNTAPTVTTTATVGSHVAGSPYAITASGAVDLDYTISYAPGTLTITAVPLTITANNQTKAYGAALPTLTVGYTGLVNGDTAANFSTPPNVAPTVTTTATAASHVAGSPYQITASGAVNLDYTISYVAGTLTVNPVPLQITAVNQTKVYGAPLPTLTVTYNGLVNGELATTTPPTVTTTATATSHVAGSPYTITASGAVDSDYSPITYTDGALTVTPAGLTITADNKTKPYGVALPVLTASYVGFVNSDTSASLTTQPSLSTTATASSHVASYPITASGAADADYNINYAAGSLTITAVPLTITPDNKTKPYAAALPTLTVSYSGFVNGDTPASLATPPSLSTTATAASHVSNNPYSITASGAVDTDYNINYVAGTLTITAVPLTITADDQTKAYGAAVPTLTVHYSGLMNGDMPITFSTVPNTPPAITTTATIASHVGGPYLITPNAAVDLDYTISYVAGNLTVTPVPLNIRANDQTKVYGAPLPTLTVAYTGLVNGDTATTTPPTVTTTATAGSLVSGNPYPITATGAVDSDYNPITYTSGALTVTPAGTATVLSSSLVTPPNSPTNITLTATVTSPTITPVGTVTFTDTSRSPVVVLGSATLSGGTASLTTTSTVLSGGPHLIVATYNPPPFTFVSSFSSGNTGPAVTITGPTSGDVHAISTVVNFTATYSDSTVAGAALTAQWSFASSDTSAAIAGPVNAATGTITGSYSFPASGVYAVALTVNDGLGGIMIANTVNSAGAPTGLPASVVVYDPSAGFVTGGGWINSPSGAYVLNPALTGKASFGFVSKYEKGATIPTGETQFTFQVANLDFHSTVYQWLVISGPMAQYKGSGTINGSGNYNFLLTGRDGSLAGGNTPDGFRIKITDPVTGATIYDNLLSTDNSVTSANTQALGGGSIMIHSK